MKKEIAQLANEIVRLEHSLAKHPHDTSIEDRIESLMTNLSMEDLIAIDEYIYENRLLN